MRSRRRRLRGSSLYLILDKESLKSRDPIKVAKDAINEGVDIIQLRDKTSCDKEIIKVGKRLKKITSPSDILLIINDRVDICRTMDADGVHLGQDDIPLKEARSILGMSRIIGVSCHTLIEAKEAIKSGADYIGIGPIFKSPTKAGLRAKGPKLLKKISKKVKVPIVAIGGINERNICKVLRSGADIIATASAILRKKNIKKATSNLKKKINKAKSKELRVNRK